MALFMLGYRTIWPVAPECGRPFANAKLFAGKKGDTHSPGLIPDHFSLGFLCHGGIIAGAA